MGEPGFWDDQQRAAEISTEHSRVAKRLERFERLTREYEDAKELLAMDGDMAAEIQSSLEPLQRELERLQEDALFSGEYDAGDAVVTIQAGTGGHRRAGLGRDPPPHVPTLGGAAWLQDRGARGQPRRGGGPQVGDLHGLGRDAYGAFKAERGVHRLVRLSPFDSAHGGTRHSHR